MTKLSIAEELAELRAEIARLQKREETLASMSKNFPVIPVFRRGWPVQRGTDKDIAHA